jgi:cyclopropane fatty-acyl-phospholipid synthase-like methyltransferase
VSGIEDDRGAIMTTSALYENGTYLSKNPTWHEEDSRWKVGHIRTILKRNGIQPTTLCEIGCGAGGILECLAEEYGNGVTCYGYEVSPQAFEICRQKEGLNLRFALGDLPDGKDTAFDVVMAIDVMEHVEDYLTFLRSVRSIGTYKVLHIPLDLSVQTVLRASPLANARSSCGHIHYFTKETALEALRDAGHRVMDCFYTASALELGNFGWKAGLLKLPRKLLFSVHQDLAVRILGGYSLMVLTM